MASPQTAPPWSFEVLKIAQRFMGKVPIPESMSVRTGSEMVSAANHFPVVIDEY